MGRLHRDGDVAKVRIAASSPLHRHAFPPSDAHEPLQVPRKAVRAGSPAGVLREELGAAFDTARGRHDEALSAYAGAANQMERWPAPGDEALLLHAWP